VPAGALIGARGLAVMSLVLERVAARRVALFVHPGPAPGDRVPEASLSEPLWWRALTDYVAQMHAAWLTFATIGRRDHPRLTVLFAMLAGGAPLHSERLAARGGPHVELRDKLVFYDTSSYGPAAIRAMIRTVGADQLVYGSDRPVVEPVATGEEARLQTNGLRLMTAIAPAT